MMAAGGDLPKVSVCMLAYNQERFVAQAIESALAQETNFPYELVIGEDCSTDGTRDIVIDLARRHPDVIRLNLAEKNQGAKNNFMRTFAECRGEYLAILECDDYWTDPGKLQMQVDALDANPSWAICFHPAQCIFHDDLPGAEVYPVGWTRPVATLDDLLLQNFIPTASALFRGGLQSKLPVWFVDVTAGDWALHLLNATRGDIGFLPKIMAVYRVHSDGFWSGRSLTDQMSEIFRLLTIIDRHFEGKYSARIEQSRINSISWIIRERDNYRQMYEQARTLQQTVAELTASNSSLRKWRTKWRQTPSYKLVHAAKRCNGFLKSLKRSLVSRAEYSRMGAIPSTEVSASAR
jgi:glycosyltransferase involved in cell wall biosynthesis